MPWSCARVVTLLERRAVGLSESERLLTESHLSECARCREQAKVLEGARQVAASGTNAVLAPLARELALKRAFDEATGTRPAAKRLWPARSWAAACVTLVVAALVAFWLARAEPPAAALAADTLESGSLSAGRELLQAGAHIPSDVALRSAGAARFRVGSALVEAAPSTGLTWRAERDTLVLDSGELNVSVEHKPGRKFLVVTANFVVEVVGTRFRVDGAGVRVTHGTVRVLSREAGEVLAVLPAGGAWSVPRAKGSDAEPAPAVVTSKPRAELEAEEASKGHAAVLEPVAQRLASARRALAAGRVSEAEKLVESALSSRASARESAEGRTLLAECAVARGQVARAAQLYLSVAKAFPALPAGENALFAGARLSERSGSKARSLALFEEYLQRYPNGRFRQEAERHLGRAPTPR